MQGAHRIPGSSGPTFPTQFRGALPIPGNAGTILAQMQGARRFPGSAGTGQVEGARRSAGTAPAPTQGVHDIPDSAGTAPLPHSPAAWASSSSSTKIKVAAVLQLASDADPSEDFVLLSTSFSEHCLTALLDVFFKLKGPPGLKHGGHIVTIPLVLLGPSFSQHKGDLVLVRGPSFEGINGPEYVRKIANTMHSLHHRGIQLSAVLYLYDALQDPSSVAVRFNVLLLESILGQGFYRRLIIVTTHWGQDFSTLARSAYYEGIFLNGVMRGFLDGGANVARMALSAEEASGPPTGFTGGVKTLREVLADLVGALEGTGNHVPLMLNEIVRLRLPQQDTTAGRAAHQQGLA